MKVLLIKDVYKLGRAGEVKEVANGYGRNYLIPQGLAVPATPQALRMAEKIRQRAEKERQEAAQQLQTLAERLQGVVLYFPMRASETGKLYGSVTTRMIADALQEELQLEEPISHRQIDSEPIRQLGTYSVRVRLTVDLLPEIRVVVYRQGEQPPQVEGQEAASEPVAEAVEEVAEAAVAAEAPAPAEAEAEP
ncbi:MAG: 50S ribosomal protein L9, partial [Chloroflexi bacterium]|nr:50S ribosomal protein L9 [Chloroflexota bacterium]